MMFSCFFSVRRRVRGVQDRERGTGRDPRRDGRQVGGGRDRLQRRQGEEKDEVSSTCTTFVKYVYNKQTSSF